MDPISLFGLIKTGISTGKSLASLSKEIGQFFDATDNAKKKLQKKGISANADVNSVAFDKWSKELKNAQIEEELKDWICDPSGLGPSHWKTLLKIRREVLAEKREAERLARREAQEKAELALTVVSILLLLIASAIGSVAYLHYMEWINVRNWFR